MRASNLHFKSERAFTGKVGEFLVKNLHFDYLTTPCHVKKKVATVRSSPGAEGELPRPVPIIRFRRANPLNVRSHSAMPCEGRSTFFRKF